MPALFYFCISALAVVVTTGALLDKKRVRRSRRVLVWVGLVLMLPFAVLALILYMLFRNGWHYC